MEFAISTSYASISSSSRALVNLTKTQGGGCCYGIEKQEAKDQINFVATCRRTLSLRIYSSLNHKVV